MSKNDFVTQLISDLTQVPVERAKSSEMSVLGAAYLAGLAGGIWKSKEEIAQLREIDRQFNPRMSVRKDYEEQIKLWRHALSRFLNWYPEGEYWRRLPTESGRHPGKSTNGLLKKVLKCIKLPLWKVWLFPEGWCLGVGPYEPKETISTSSQNLNSVYLEKQKLIVSLIYQNRSPVYITSINSHRVCDWVSNYKNK